MFLRTLLWGVYGAGPWDRHVAIGLPDECSATRVTAAQLTTRTMRQAR